MKEIFPSVYEYNHSILTKNLIPGKKVYGERLYKFNSNEFRQWIPFRSKIAAAIKKNLKNFPVKEGSKILYLGVAEGTTASHLSDIIGLKGLLAGIDISKKTMKKFIQLCEERKNMIPLLADASKPESYFDELKIIRFDLLFQDLSQKNQAEIFLKNARLFLPKNAFGMIAIKAKSISSTRKPREIFEEQKKLLEKEFKILECISLEPYEKDHLFCVMLKK